MTTPLPGSSSAAAPSVSLVMTARHDRYGGSPEERIFGPLRFNTTRLAERGIRYEVVFVEWNPVPGRPLLSELLAREFPDLVNGPLTRIVVAPEYQAAMEQNPRAGYLEYVARNVGIRRAAAPMILGTNVDILLGRTVVEALAAGDLARDVIYRAARYDIKLGADQTGIDWDALEDPANHVRRPVLRPPLYSGGAADFLLADRDTFHRLRGFNEVYRAARSGLDFNFLVKAHGAGVRIVDIGGPVYHLNHVGSMRIAKSLYRDTPADTPWGNLRWHSGHVTYNNPENWGLGNAPERRLDDGARFIEFSWDAVPPLVDLRRVVLPTRRVGETAEGGA